MKIGPIALVHKAGAALIAVLSPFGIWGLAGLAFIDAALFPLPTTMDGAVIGYVALDHQKFLLYCLVAAAATTLGSLIPYYVGRAGGEIFLLKRINRERYEKMRDRFAAQEFLAIMIPAMCPPPMPFKLFEIGAGVFEMRPQRYAVAVFTGKMIQFLVCALITIYFGPTIAHAFRMAMHEHLNEVLTVTGILALVIVVYVLRKLFNRRSGTQFPLEESTDSDSTAVAPSDSTLIT